MGLDASLCEHCGFTRPAVPLPAGMTWDSVNLDREDPVDYDSGIAEGISVGTSKAHDMEQETACPEPIG